MQSRFFRALYLAASLLAFAQLAPTAALAQSEPATPAAPAPAAPAMETVLAEVMEARGPVTYVLPGEDTEKPLTAGLKVPVGTRLRTGPEGHAILVIVPGAAVQVAENTDMTLERAQISSAEERRLARRAALVRLREGTVGAMIDSKRSDETDFKIQTPQGVAAARGTFYAVTVEDGETYVGVKKGKVGIRRLDPAATTETR